MKSNKIYSCHFCLGMVMKCGGDIKEVIDIVDYIILSILQTVTKICWCSIRTKKYIAFWNVSFQNKTWCNLMTIIQNVICRLENCKRPKWQNKYDVWNCKTVLRKLMYLFIVLMVKICKGHLSRMFLVKNVLLASCKLN